MGNSTTRLSSDQLDDIFKFLIEYKQDIQPVVEDSLYRYLENDYGVINYILREIFKTPVLRTSDLVTERSNHYRQMLVTAGIDYFWEIWSFAGRLLALSISTNPVQLELGKYLTNYLGNQDFVYLYRGQDAIVQDGLGYIVSNSLMSVSLDVDTALGFTTEILLELKFPIGLFGILPIWIPRAFSSDKLFRENNNERTVEDLELILPYNVKLEPIQVSRRKYWVRDPMTVYPLRRILKDYIVWECDVFVDALTPWHVIEDRVFQFANRLFT
jgi:hypothetical protein